MTLTRWDPFRDLLGLQNRISQVLSDSRPWDGADATYGQWVPPVDIVERGDDLVIRAELPGIEADAIDVRVDNNTLHLSGERKHEVEGEEGKTYRRERVYGSFSRSFSLPATVNAAKIAARHKDGILEIVLPKAEEAKPRRVQIHAA